MIRCNKCLMNSDVPNFVKSENCCNYCDTMRGDYSNLIISNDNTFEFIKKIKEDGKNKSYDCIIGVSGGLDSSYALHLAVEQGLRPLAVHMDNGWNSELAQNNISNLVDKLKVDLYTHVIDWEEYRAMMQAFFDSDVIDVELLYDNAMLAVNYQIASKYNIKYILAGTNNATEGIPIPSGWNWYKYDKKNIKSICKKFNKGSSFNSFPFISTIDRLFYRQIKNIQWLSFLDYFDYKKDDAIKLLVNKYNYKPYPYKHYESVFTRFYQGYILPNKFKVDKRLPHLSALVVNGQMSRENALEILEGSPYPSNNELNSDIEYFLKKMDWSLSDLDSYIKRPRVEHSQYPSEFELSKYFTRLKKWMS